MCSCGNDCIDAPAEKREFTFTSEAPPSFGFFSVAPDDTDDLMYAETDTPRIVYLAGEDWAVCELSPEQQSIYAQAYKHGSEDAVRTITAIESLAEPQADGPPEDSAATVISANFREIDLNFEEFAEAHNELVDEVEDVEDLLRESLSVVLLTFEAFEAARVSLEERVQGLEEEFFGPAF